MRRFRVMTPREWHQPRMHAAREVNDLKQSVLITYSTEPMSIIFGPWLRHGLGPEKQLDIGNSHRYLVACDGEQNRSDP